MKNYLKSQRGVAFIIAISVLLLVLLIGLVSLKTSTTDQSISSNTQRSTRASYAAEAGVMLGRQTIWNSYVNAVLTSPPKSAGSTGDINAFQTYLASIGLSNGACIKVNANHTVGGSAKVDSVKVSRRDKPGNVTELEIVSFGSEADGINSKIGAVYTVTGVPFRGFDYALLSNQVNCIMCHATFDNADRFWNKDASKNGSFDRIKIASLQNLMVRVGSSDSKVYGTLYSRGIVTDNSGNPLSSISTSTISGMKLDGSNGHIVEPLVSTALSNTTGSPLSQYGNLYMNYPTDEADMTDGYLPDQFPPAIPDLNGNKLVDDNEFDQIKNQVTGTISGGVIYGVSSGSFSGSALPSTGNLSSISRTYDGNLILVGTPILLPISDRVG
ncbi:MAG TPA: PilX N-terminal domain-containing pilus assembly protein [Verrucomicrobiae bacterium]|nr:PilX N-terminal domain-containing pilus assembly protein [Verrucomicrobiae bacterium]